MADRQHVSDLAAKKLDAKRVPAKRMGAAFNLGFGGAQFGGPNSFPGSFGGGASGFSGAMDGMPYGQHQQQHLHNTQQQRYHSEQRTPFQPLHLNRHLEQQQGGPWQQAPPPMMPYTPADYLSNVDQQRQALGALHNDIGAGDILAMYREGQDPLPPAGVPGSVGGYRQGPAAAAAAAAQLSTEEWLSRVLGGPGITTAAIERYATAFSVAGFENTSLLAELVADDYLNATMTDILVQ
jgi:hypothetical protein